MRTGFPEFLREWWWRGRRYVGGVIFGLWGGVWLGVLLGRQLSAYYRSAWWLFPLLLVASPIVGAISNWISRPTQEFEADGRDR